MEHVLARSRLAPAGPAGGGRACVGDLKIPCVMSRSTGARIIFSFPEAFPWFPSPPGCEKARQESALTSCSGGKCEEEKAPDFLAVA